MNQVVKRWPVDPKKYPLRGRMTGPVYMPPEDAEAYEKYPGWLRALIFLGASIAMWLIIYAAIIVSWAATQGPLA